MSIIPTKPPPVNPSAATNLQMEASPFLRARPASAFPQSSAEAHGLFIFALEEWLRIASALDAFAERVEAEESSHGC